MTHLVSSASSSSASQSSASQQPSPSRLSQHAPSAFPTPGAVAPATFTAASAHAAPASPASTLAVTASSAPQPSSSPAPAGAAPPTAARTTAATPASPSIATENKKVLPYLFDDAHIDDVLVLVVDMLAKLTEHNDSLPLHPSALTRFHSRATPNISLSAYLRRIAKYTSIEKCCVLILLVYIDRVCERLEGFTICGLTVHRFICAAILCASKALCDAFNTNEHYAKVGGISLQEINLLEKEFLQIIDWRLICSGAVLQHYYASLVRSHQDYVLAEPAAGGEMEVDVSSASSASAGSSSRAAVNVKPAGASQHSSPFPISSSSGSPFTPSSSTVNASGGLVAASSSGSSHAALSANTSPQSMQVDTEAAPTASRRRKDEHRTPPSPRIAVQALQSNGHAAEADAFKRTRLDQQPPPS